VALAPGLAHLTDCSLTANQHRKDVDVKHISPLGKPAIGNGAWMVYSGRIDHDIEAACLLRCSGDEGS
jgi:hypothetical protein